MTTETQAETGWTRERIELIKRTVVPKGIPDDEFTLFLEQCKRSGLDPLLKEAFCVGRRQNTGTKERPAWSTRYEFQPSEAGMLSRAERFSDFRGIQASAVYAEDEIVIDQGKGEVVHRFNPAKRKGSLVGAWARVEREGKLPVLVWLDFQGYVQQTPLWGKIPDTMISKCARVAALRKAYPSAFGGLYIREEMPAEEYEAPREAEAKPEVLGKVKALPSETTVERLESAPSPAPARLVILPEDPAQAKPEKKGGQHRAVPPGPVVVSYGPHRGKAVTALTDSELSATIDLGVEKLREDPKATWAKATRANLSAMEEEFAKRWAPKQGELQVARVEEEAF